MIGEKFASVWDAIEDTPAEAENMKLRAALMRTLEQHIQAQGWTQAEAARLLGVTQPRISGSRPGLSRNGSAATSNRARWRSSCSRSSKRRASKLSHERGGRYRETSPSPPAVRKLPTRR